MVVHRFWADGEELEPGGRSTVPQPFSGLLRTAVRCSNAALSPSEDGWERTGDPSEIALGREPAEPGIMRRPPRPREKGIMDRQMLTRAWGWLGLVEAALVVCGFFYVMGAAGWMPGDPTGPGSPLHAAYLTATTMTFAGITACQIGTAFAARTSRASLREIGIFSNKLLLWGVLFELVFAAAVIYLPPLQHVFGTRALGAPELAILAAFPFVVWGTDELRRWALRRKSPVEAGRIRQS
jgi:magnesium-transporting ATPase (P-type)